MTKILEPKECLRRFIEGKIQHNRDLHEAGLKNLYFEWESFGNDILNQADLLESYVQQCGELRSANEFLKHENERLSKYREDYYNLKKDYEAVVSKLESLENVYSRLMNGNDEEDSGIEDFHFYKESF